MSEDQITQIIKPQDLVRRTKDFLAKNARLVQICCTTLKEGKELNYSFDCAGNFENLKIKLAPDELVVPSISSVYMPAFLYENEIQDLFGLKFDGLSLNYNGNFYRMAVKHPFAAPAADKKEETK